MNNALEYIKNLCQIKRNFRESLQGDGLVAVLNAEYVGEAKAYADIAQEISKIEDHLPVQIKPPPLPKGENL